MAKLYANFVDAELVSGIDASTTSLVVPVESATAMPTPVAGTSTFSLAIFDGQQLPEIVSCTENDGSGTLVVDRAQEGTTAKAWAAGSRVRLTVTAGLLGSLADFQAEVEALAFSNTKASVATSPRVKKLSGTSNLVSVLNELSSELLASMKARVLQTYAELDSALSDLADGTYIVLQDEQLQADEGLPFAPASARAVAGGVVTGTENLDRLRVDLSMPNVTAARELNSAIARIIFVEGLDGGFFRRDSSDTSSPEDGGSYCGTIIRGADYATRGVWRRIFSGPLSPKWFGGNPNARVYEQSTGKWVFETSPQDSSAAIRAALAVGPVELDGWYAVYPQSSGQQFDLTGGNYVSRGMIAPGQTYIVGGSSGAVTYDGASYAPGQTFVGVSWSDDYTSSGDALPYYRIKAAVYVDARAATAGSNNTRYVSIKSTGTSGLVLMESGCALALFGSVSNGSYIVNADIDVEVVAHTDVGDVESIGIYLESLAFAGHIRKLRTDSCRHGVIINNCWNLDVAHIATEFGGNGRCGVIVHNFNQQRLGHVFTHGQGRMSGWVDFLSAHGAIVGDTITVSFDGNAQFTGTVNKILSPTRLNCDNYTRQTSTTLGVWRASINGAAAVPIIDARSTHGVGVLCANSEGSSIYADFQHRGGCGIRYVVDNVAGSLGLCLSGHIEGPASGVEVIRRISSGQLRALDATLSGFTAREDSGSDFGQVHFYNLEYVHESRLGPGSLQVREWQNTATGVTTWAASTPYTLNDIVVQPWGFYKCTTAGTSASDSRGPTGRSSSITDGTVVWAFIRRPNTSVLIEDTCNSVYNSARYVDHNVGIFRVVDMQPRPATTLTDQVLLDSAEGTVLFSFTNITATVSVQRANLVGSITQLPNEARPPKALRLRLDYTVNTAPTGTGSFVTSFKTDEMHTNNRVFSTVTASQARDAASIPNYVDIPVSAYKGIQYQLLVTGTGWNVSGTARIIGYWF